MTADNWDGGVQIESIADPADDSAESSRRRSRIRTRTSNIQPAAEAYELVLANAGATRPKRDAVDERVIKMVRTGKVDGQAGDKIWPRSSRRSAIADSVIRAITDLVDKGIITDIEPGRRLSGVPRRAVRRCRQRRHAGRLGDEARPQSARRLRRGRRPQRRRLHEHRGLSQRPRSEGRSGAVAGAADVRRSMARSGVSKVKQTWPMTRPVVAADGVIRRRGSQQRRPSGYKSSLLFRLM